MSLLLISNKKLYFAVMMLIFLLAPSLLFGAGERDIKYLNNLNKRFDDYKNDSSTEEALMILSDAETVLRLIVSFDIEEEGGNDSVLGEFISRLIEQERWDVLDIVLRNHYYYPQSSSWILEIMSEKDDKLKSLMDKYNFHLRQADWEIKSAAKKITDNRQQQPSRSD